MKKIMITIMLLFMSFSTLDAINGPMNPNALKHANPMPNLMRIAVGNADLLGLNAEQMKSLQEWINTNKAKNTTWLRRRFIISPPQYPSICRKIGTTTKIAIYQLLEKSGAFRRYSPTTN